MHRLRRQTLRQLLLSTIMAAPLVMVYFGVEPIWPLRVDSIWPHTPLVSVPEGATADVWSSVPGLLSVAVAAIQCMLLVEVVRYLLLLQGSMTPTWFVGSLAYELALLVDMFRRWGHDWFIWALHELRLGELCDPGEACFPVTDALPWGSFIILCLLLMPLWRFPSRSGSARRLP